LSYFIGYLLRASSLSFPEALLFTLRLNGDMNSSPPCNITWCGGTQWVN
jgi:hypothetical protein